MARELKIDIKVDSADATRQLTAVDTAVTGVTKSADAAHVATSKWQDTLKNLGTVASVVAGVGLYQAVAGLINFGKEALADADALTKLRDKTGISIEALQRLRAVGDDAGNGLNQITAAITMMQKRLVEGDGSAVAALAKLHLHLEDIRKLQPEQQFEAIGKAIAGIHDRVQVAMALFGRTGADILPTLTADFDTLTKGIYVMSEGSVTALDATGDAFGRLYRSGKAWVGDALGGVIARAIADYRSLQVLTGEGATEFANLLTVQEQADKLIPHMAAGTRDLSLSLEEQTAIEKNLNGQLKVHTEETRKAVDAQKTFRDAVREATDKFTGGTLALHRYIDAIPGARAGNGQLAETFFNLRSAVGYTTKDIEYLERSGRFTAAALVELKDKIVAIPGAAGNMSAALRDTTRDVQSMSSRITGDLSQALSRIPQMFVDAFTGGGGVLGALKGIGVSLLDAITRELLQPIWDAVAKWAVGIAAKIVGALSGSSGVGGGFTPGLIGGGGAGGAGIGASFAAAAAVAVPAYIGAQFITDLINGNTGQTSPSGWINGVYVPPSMEMGGGVADHFGLPGHMVDADNAIFGRAAFEGYASGTGGRYLDFGAGTPVTLHGRERVMTEAEGRAGGDINVTFHVDGYVDSPAAQRRLGEIMEARLMRIVAQRGRV